jgi:hypothetical protein
MRKNGKVIYCDQTPRNLFYIEEILKLYPKAKLINMLRDPRDVLLSQKNRWRRRYLGDDSPLIESVRAWVNYHPITMSMLWRSSIRTALRHADNPRVISVRFEDFIQHPEHTVRKICDFLGLPFTEDMLLVPNVGSSIEQDQPTKTEINKNAVGRWKKGGLTTTEVFLCQKITGQEMAAVNYLQVPARPKALQLIVSILSLITYSLISVILNAPRIKNLKAAFMRRAVIR